MNWSPNNNLIFLLGTRNKHGNNAWQLYTSSGMLRRVALVRADVSEEHSSSSLRLTKIGELGTTLAVTSNRRSVRSPILDTLMEELSSSETSVLTRATQCNIAEDAIRHSRLRENLKSYSV
jgi:hypothetical protein